MVEWIGVSVATEQPQEDALQHIFCVGGVACNPVRRPEDKTVLGTKGLFEFVRDCDCRFL
jgi:hypothetical protein